MKTNYFFLIASLFCVMTVSAVPTRGLQFTGASASYLNVGSHTAFSPTQFTIETWAYYESTNGAYIISNEGHDGTKGAHGLALRTSGAKVELSLGANGSWPNIRSTADIVLNTWMHIAVTYSPTEMKMYINGVEDATVAVTSPMVASDQSLSIGEGAMWKDRRFTGKLSDLRFWNVVRTPAEIAAAMSASLEGTETGLVANWKMDEGTGSSVVDFTGNFTVNNKPGEVVWFNTSTSVDNTLSDKIKVSVAGKTLKVANNFSAPVQISVYNVAGQKIMEDQLGAGNSFEKQMNNLTGVFVLKCVAVDGTTSIQKFKL